MNFWLNSQLNSQFTIDQIHFDENPHELLKKKYVYIVHCWWEYKLIRPRRRAYWHYPSTNAHIFWTSISVLGHLFYTRTKWLEKEMATHSSILSWRIPWTEEPVRPHSVHGNARVRHDLATKQWRQNDM